MRIFLASVTLLFISTTFAETWDCESSSFSVIDEEVTDISCVNTAGKSFSYDKSIDQEEKILKFLIGLDPDITVKAQGLSGSYMEGITIGEGKILAKVNYSNGDTYEGELSGIMVTGRGVFFHKEKNYIYEGDFIDGWETGKGKKSFFLITNTLF